MQIFTLFGADQRESATNTLYPHRFDVKDKASLREAVSKDYVCAEYKNNHRSNSDFIWSNVLAIDCDNTHSDTPEDWKTPEDIAKQFKDVAFAVHYSRNHNKVKKGRAARPKFHCLFPIGKVNNRNEYGLLKQRILKEFPFMDEGSIDDAHFFFGTENPQIEIFEGSKTLEDYFFDQDMTFPETEILEGQRNIKMLSAANALLKRYGNTEQAKQLYDEKAKECKPPLPSDELSRIWSNAQAFYENVLSKSDGYIDPALYNEAEDLKPAEYSDADQATVLKEVYGDRMAFSRSAGYLIYEKPRWIDEEVLAVKFALNLTSLQKIDAQLKLDNAKDYLKATGAAAILEKEKSENAAVKAMNEEQQKAYKAFKIAQGYRKYVVKQRNYSALSSTLKAMESMALTDLNEFDAHPFLLNTPEATYDLRKGLEGAREPDSSDKITMVTAVSPGDEGKEMWLDCLNTTFCGDQELIEYVQMICGMAVIGKVFDESLIIAYGDGANGKSTFWNTIARVLGTYSGNVSAETLTNAAKHNVKAEMAELRGKRLAIAAEMGSNQRLNDSIVKQLCSTDPIFAEKKYKAPFKFIPQHTLVLYTNNLPRVTGTDIGIWRRLKVIPFNAYIQPSKDVKNYAAELFDHAAPAVLSWIIEGSKKAIEKDFKFDLPECVKEATTAYRDQNDWINHFLEECCEIGSNYKERSQKLIDAFKRFKDQTGEGPDYTPTFTKELEKKFRKKKTSKGHVFQGLKLKELEEDPAPSAAEDFEDEKDYGF